MPRRTKGDGGLIQRHDHPTCPPLDKDGNRPEHRCRGRWSGVATVTINGLKQRKYVYASTQKGAKIKLTQVLELDRQGRVTVGSMTLETWLAYWLENIAAHDLKPQTLRGYHSKVRTLINPHLGNLRIDRIRAEHIRSWHAILRERGSQDGKPVSGSTLRQVHLILKGAMRAAVYDKRLPESVMDNMKNPPIVKGKRIGHSVEDAAKILTTAGSDARWWLNVFYGMRQGEALGLHWRDIDFEAGEIHIVQTLQRNIDGTWIFGAPKSEKSARTMPMLEPIRLRLQLHQPVGVDPDSLVFHNKGKPIRPWVDNRAWHELLDAAGVPALPLHSGRHTAASALEAAGVPGRLAMQILGHSQLHTTHDYTHADMQRQAEALQSAFDVLAILP